MSSDVFIISSARDPGPAAAIRQAIDLAGLSPARIQDVVFGLHGASADLGSITNAAGLTCPFVGVSSDLRALSFSAASVLSDDANLAVVIGLAPDDCAAILVASPETVGLLNLLPRARLAARALAGPDAALRLAGLASSDVQLCKDGDSLILLHELLDDLESQSARWGLISSPDISLLLERL